eukprot:358341-Chlamydomonas_euryale.AAC.6
MRVFLMLSVQTRVRAATGRVTTCSCCLSTGALCCCSLQTRPLLHAPAGGLAMACARAGWAGSLCTAGRGAAYIFASAVGSVGHRASSA